jgi:hypothetical protein
MFLPNTVLALLHWIWKSEYYERICLNKYNFFFISGHLKNVHKDYWNMITLHVYQPCYKIQLQYGVKAVNMLIILRKTFIWLSKIKAT